MYRYLSFVNLLKTQYTEDTGSNKFKKYDYNNNGSLCLAEFKDIILKDPEVGMLFRELGFAKEIEGGERDKDIMKEKAELKEGEFEQD